MEPEKATWWSPEFWLTVSTAAISFIAFLVSAGVVSSADQEHLSKAVSGAIAGVGALVTNAMVIWQYLRSRRDVKVEAAKTEQVARQAAAQIHEAETRKYEAVAAMPPEVAMRMMQPMQKLRGVAVKEGQ
jgi:LmbE family N-acetylglucosaminyl deacetylase